MTQTFTDANTCLMGNRLQSGFDNDQECTDEKRLQATLRGTSAKMILCIRCWQNAVPQQVCIHSLYFRKLIEQGNNGEQSDFELQKRRGAYDSGAGRQMQAVLA
ncbi:MAG: hypothetical protein FRX49_05041 [Trebouxia sp. A1-2]|nr:MAG: hypothetical protein FRX49_05041 [Trebouxia sp. A1-2]